MNLRDYQLQGMRDIFNGWSTHDILMFILATGGGKTVTFVDVIKQFLAGGKRTLLIAHRQELINQAWNTLYENKIYSGIIKASHKRNYDLRSQIGSVQTLTRRDLSLIPKPDLIVIDEGHHAQQDNGYGSILKFFPDAKVLVVTATPYRLSGEGFTELVKGKETKLIINQTLAQLQSNGYLVPFDYYVASIPDMRGVATKGGDYAEEEAEKVMKLAPLVQSYKEHANGKCGVVFACTVHHSKQIAEQYNLAGIPAEHFDANTSDEERQAILARFRNRETLVLTNVGIITEGFDMPDMEFVQLARPTKSLSMYLQMVGRATRALRGLVDGPEALTVEQRKANIAASRKPCAIILDNAGAWLENGLPDDNYDWEMYFKGTKGRKKKTPDEEIEILIYVADDGEGGTFRTKNPQEVEGLRLVRIDKEMREKVVNVKALKEFDRQYAIGKNLFAVKHKGIFAINAYLNYCRKNNFAVTQDAWDYIEKRLVKDIADEIERHTGNMMSNLGVAYIQTEEFNRQCNSIRMKGLGRSQFKAIKAEYERGKRVF